MARIRLVICRSERFSVKGKGHINHEKKVTQDVTQAGPRSRGGQLHEGQLRKWHDISAPTGPATFTVLFRNEKRKCGRVTWSIISSDANCVIEILHQTYILSHSKVLS